MWEYAETFGEGGGGLTGAFDEGKAGAAGGGGGGGVAAACGFGRSRARGLGT